MQLESVGNKELKREGFIRRTGSQGVGKTRRSPDGNGIDTIRIKVVYAAPVDMLGVIRYGESCMLNNEMVYSMELLPEPGPTCRSLFPWATTATSPRRRPTT